MYSTRLGSQGGRRPRTIARARQSASRHGTSLRRGVTAVAQKDKIIASHAPAPTRRAVVRYSRTRRVCPPNGSRWARHSQQPGLIAMEPSLWRELERQQLWFEWKSCATCAASLPSRSTIFPRWPRGSHRPATGEAALSAGTAPWSRGGEVLQHLSARALTAMMSGLLQHLSISYRLLAELLLRQGWTDLVLNVAHHFAYYGQVARGARDGIRHRDFGPRFWARLCEHAFELASSGARHHAGDLPGGRPRGGQQG